MCYIIEVILLSWFYFHSILNNKTLNHTSYAFVDMSPHIYLFNPMLTHLTKDTRKLVHIHYLQRYKGT